jgi:hypothetical protein
MVMPLTIFGVTIQLGWLCRLSLAQPFNLDDYAVDCLRHDHSTWNKGLKIIEEKELYLYIDISKWLDFRVFSDKDVSYMAGTADPLSIWQ